MHSLISVKSNSIVNRIQGQYDGIRVTPRMFIPRVSSLLALYTFVYIPSCTSAVSNRTIDDVYGDTVTGLRPIYGPSNAPYLVVENNCIFCLVQPDAAQTVDHSWHDVIVANDATYTVTIQFTGTAIYFFGIVPNTVPGGHGIRAVNTNFSLDGASSGSYTHLQDPTTSTMLYHVPMFALDGLSNDTHTLVAYAQSSSWLFFDYALYTFEDGNASTSTSVGTPVLPSTKAAGTSTGSSSVSMSQGVIPTNTTAASIKSHSRTAIVVGSVCGALVIMLVAGALIWFRRRRKYRNALQVQPEPFVVGLTPHEPSSSRAGPPETREVSHPQNSTQWPESQAVDEIATALPPYTPHARDPLEPAQDSAISLLAGKQRMNRR
ncbi:hypothetical protein C8R45DRAFT_377773 [Mycena sanguinolenta]|nr:hypothetical protein C8R45DRAFT_377773 [Mycena sanguinolenta]